MDVVHAYLLLSPYLYVLQAVAQCVCEVTVERLTGLKCIALLENNAPEMCGMWGGMWDGAALSSLISCPLNAIILLICFKKDRIVKLLEFPIIKKSELKTYLNFVHQLRKETRILPPASDTNA